MATTEKPEEFAETIISTTEVEVIEVNEEDKVNTQEQQDNWNTNNE